MQFHDEVQRSKGRKIIIGGKKRIVDKVDEFLEEENLGDVRDHEVVILKEILCTHRFYHLIFISCLEYIAYANGYIPVPFNQIEKSLSEMRESSEGSKYSYKQKKLLTLTEQNYSQFKDIFAKIEYLSTKLKLKSMLISFGTSVSNIKRFIKVNIAHLNDNAANDNEKNNTLLDKMKRSVVQKLIGSADNLTMNQVQGSNSNLFVLLEVDSLLTNDNQMKEIIDNCSPIFTFRRDYIPRKKSGRKRNHFELRIIPDSLPIIANQQSEEKENDSNHNNDNNNHNNHSNIDSNAMMDSDSSQSTFWFVSESRIKILPTL